MPLLPPLPRGFLDPRRPYLSLTLLFAAWKLIILTIVLAAPGAGYDTSTTVLPPFIAYKPTSGPARKAVRHITAKFVRWDAIYFTHIALRGYVYEQEWAFGWGHTEVLGVLARAIFGTEKVGTGEVALAGMALAQLSHWGSVLVLYELTKEVFDTVPGNGRERLTFVSAFFHIISPAGVFLSAPYAEAPFSLLSFAGSYAYVRSVKTDVKTHAMSAAAWIVSAGLLFGIATTFRGNGLLNGLLLVADTWQASVGAVKCFRDQHALTAYMRRLGILLLSGILMTCVALWPQYLAYREFCLDISQEQRRPWCHSLLPSIYAWVQEEYWGVGFLRYWTLFNVPLFFLAAPMLTMLLISSHWALTCRTTPVPKAKKDDKRQDQGLGAQHTLDLLFSLTVPPSILAILALTTYHVQIITRLSSGYSIWYWWLASLLVCDGSVQGFGRKMSVAKGIVTWLVMYALIQAGLFASFLPPA